MFYSHSFVKICAKWKTKRDGMKNITLTILLLSFCLVSKQLFAFDLIAHRGASGYLPEHSKEALVMAFMQGADYIEQDLVMSKDGHLLVLHDIHIETVTDVEEKYPERKRKDGRFYAIDFMLSELRKLRLHERETKDQKLVYPKRYSGQANFTVATFSEHIELIENLNRMLQRNVGLYTEIKAPRWHSAQGFDIEKALANVLEKKDLNRRESKLIVQSFDANSLKRLKVEFKLKVNLVQLIADNSWGESSTDYDRMQTEQGMKEVAEYADGIGPWIPQIIDLKKQEMTPVYHYARENGLFIHPYTYREDQPFSGIRNQALFKLLSNNVDGVFTDHIKPHMTLDKK